MWWFEMIGVRVRSVGEGAKALSANAGRRVNFTHDLRMSLRGAIIAFIRRGINDNPCGFRAMSAMLLSGKRRRKKARPA